MQFSQRSYSGKLFLPRPEVHLGEDGNLLIVATPWGSRGAARKAIDSVEDFVLSSLADKEVTSPFDVLTSLSPLANHLRVALMLLNDQVLKEENGEEWTTRIEISVVIKSQSELVYANIGQPQIFLDRPGFNLSSLSASPNLSLSFSTGEGVFPPLPDDLLGIHGKQSFRVSSVSVRPKDRLILLSRTTAPPEFFCLPRSQRDLENLSRVLSESDTESPFWLGVLNI